MVHTDTFYINLCVTIANAAKKNGNAAAGCVLVKENIIIARAGEASVSKQDITCHAEIEVIRKAVKKIGPNLSGCSLYTTHEPCVMCAYPIRYYGVSTIVIYKPVEFFGSTSALFPLLTTRDTPQHWAAPPDIRWIDPVPAH